MMTIFLALQLFWLKLPQEIPPSVLDKIEVLPQPWFALAKEDPAQTAVLKELIRMSSSQRDHLLTHGDARERGIAVFVASEQGEIKSLLAMSHLLDDRSETIPGVAYPAEGGYARKPQTVGEIVARAYDYWFGLGAPTSLDQFKVSRLASIEDPERQIYPWLARLRTARALSVAGAAEGELSLDLRSLGERGLHEAKLRIRRLPEEVRWAVVTMAYMEGRQLEQREEARYYTDQEARQLISALSQAQRAAILSRKVDLSFDPRLRAGADGQEARRLMDEAIRLLEEPPTGNQPNSPVP